MNTMTPESQAERDANDRDEREWMEFNAPHLLHMQDTPISDRTNKYRKVYMKKNKAHIRRERHRRRVHRMITNARIPPDKRVRAGHFPADHWKIDITRYEDLLITLFRWSKFANGVNGRVANCDLPHREMAAVSYIELCPILVSMAVRGRRSDQMQAEFNEARGRIRRLDVR